jgi:hypothetical protein
VSDLVIIARNEQPSRDETYPRTWLVYRYTQSTQSTLEVDVEHNNGKPFVVGPIAA